MEGDQALRGTPSSSILKTTQFSSDDLQVYPDDYFNDWHGRFYSGTHRDTNFTVTDFAKLDDDNNKGVITFAPALSEAAVVGDVFEMYPDYTPSEMNDAINLAISMVEEEALKDQIDETILIVSSTFEYLIPDGLLFIDQVVQESGTAGRYSISENLIDIRHWGILRRSDPQLWFDNNYCRLTAGRHLRLIGQGIQSQLSADDNLCSVNQTFLVHQAKALLHQSRIRGQGADFDEHQSQMQVAQAMADRQRAHVQVSGRGKRVAY
jgi:hypothetical protein